MLEAVEGGLYLLEALEVIRCMLLCMLEVVEGGLCMLEVVDGGLSFRVSKIPLWVLVTVRHPNCLQSIPAPLNCAMKAIVMANSFPPSYVSISLSLSFKLSAEMCKFGPLNASESCHSNRWP
jgi:hypothetical protein